MLSLKPDDLAEEINRAEEFRKRHTQKNAAIAQRFLSNWYRTDAQTTATPENSVYSYVAYMLPELWYASPSCRVKAKRPLQDKQVAEWMEQALRSWLSETDFTDEGQDVVRDAIFGFGFMQIGLEPRDNPGEGRQQVAPGGQPREPLRPFAVRLSNDQLIIDPRCESPLSARYIGHTYSMDLDDIKADPERWPPEGVSKLTEAPDSGTTQDHQNERPIRYGDAPDRHRVNLVDLWIPEHGVIVTLARDYNAVNVMLRQEKYWGPPEGPYEVFGFYRVPGDVYPLGPIQPVMEQLEEMWAHQRQASDEASSYKRFALVEAAATDTAKALIDTPSGGVAAVRGMTGTFQEVELGGSPTGRLEHIMTLRDRADRTIGLSDAQRGKATGRTATETDIVQGNVDTRTGFMRQRIQRHTERVLRRVGWYMFFDPSIVMPVSSTDPATGLVTEGTFLGGIQPGQEGSDWLDFHLQIEPTSMQHADDQVLQARALEMIQIVAPQVAQGMAMMPQVNWRALVNAYGESFDQPDLFATMFNPMPPPPPVLPPGANPEMAAALGASAQPMPGMGGLPPGAAGGMAGGMMGGGFPPGQASGPAALAGPGGPPPSSPSFAPRAGTIAPSFGQGGPPTTGGPRTPGPAKKPGFMFIGKGATGGPRAAKPGGAAPKQPALTGGPRAKGKA